MRYMLVETFLHGARPVYERVAARGRLLPPGLVYVDSWIDERLRTCFQLMETDDPILLNEWMDGWRDLVAFEVIPPVDSDEAAPRALGSDAGS